MINFNFKLTLDNTYGDDKPEAIRQIEQFLTRIKDVVAAHLNEMNEEDSSEEEYLPIREPF